MTLSPERLSGELANAAGLVGPERVGPAPPGTACGPEAKPDSLGTRAATQPTAGQVVRDTPPALRISSYKILGVLGEGSMGVVYRAQQDNPHRVVALKVLKAGGATAKALKRFEHEAQVLGRLQHPGIAQVFEAGTADSGHGPQPFFAMELIRGTPLEDYAQTQGLTCAQRLALLVKVCAGVQHAHQKGVIHRDLKPGNILVDESGQPKILDFGIALVTDSDSRVSEAHTYLKQLAGTIPYMGFEQVKGDPRELDTRIDVYALGVIAYQLLAGRLPYDLKDKTLPEALRIIAEQEPTPLGTVDRSLRGDVETIVAKALEKDKTRRYQSASEFAADIERFLSDQAILARPPSAIYHFGKFAKRNKALVGGIGGVFVMLVVAITGTGLGLREAEKEATKSKATFDFLVYDMLTSADPRIAQGREITVKDVLRNASDRIESAFSDKPEVEASIRVTLGKIYNGLSDYAPAELHLREAEEILRRRRGENDPQTLRARTELADSLLHQGKYAQADTLLRQTLTAQSRVMGDEHADTLRTMYELALLSLTQGKLDEARQRYDRTLGLQRRYLGDDHPQTLETTQDLAAVHLELGELAEAERQYRLTLAIARDVLGDTHPHTLVISSNLALVLKSRGRLEEAERLYRQTLQTQRRVSGNEHLDTVISMHNLVLVLHELGDLDAAEELEREAVEILRATAGDNHPRTIYAIIWLALLLEEKGEYAEAETLQREVLELRRELNPKGDPIIATSLIRLGMVLMKKGEPAGAQPLLGEALEIRKDALPAGDWRIANTESVLGGCLTAQGRFSEAESLLLKTWPIIEGQRGESDRLTREALERIVKMYQEWGKPGIAADYRALLPATQSGE